jgi:HupE / UreJ protein
MTKHLSYLFATSLIAVLLIAAPALAHNVTEADQQAMLEAGYWGYLVLGAKHMLTGYDHLLFLFGVIFFLTSFKGVVKFVTAFTLGHCITLIAATLMGMQANYFLIDAVIALTVIYKAFDNLDGFKKYLDMQSPSLIGMVFAFGLIHGFGLSTRLQQLPLGDGFGLVLRILSFNVGVEVGQVIALAVMMVLLAGWRKRPSFQQFGKAANVSLMIVGFLLVLMQLHGYQHSSFADEFPLNKDDHSHIHDEMAFLGTDGIEEAETEPAVGKFPPEETVIDVAPVSGHQHGDGQYHQH